MCSTHGQEEKEKGLESHSPPQGHTSSDLRTFQQVPPLKSSTMSQYHHSGNQTFNIWVFRGFPDSNCNTTQDQAASTNQLLTNHKCVCGPQMWSSDGLYQLSSAQTNNLQVESKQMPQFGSRLLGSNRQLEVYSASGTALGKGISSWVPRHILILQMLRVQVGRQTCGKRFPRRVIGTIMGLGLGLIKGMQKFREGA